MSTNKRKLIQWIKERLPLCNIILLESVPDLSDNTKAVFDEMIRRGLNRKYRLVWVLGEKCNDYPKMKKCQLHSPC